MIKSNDIQWEECSLYKDPLNAINYILSQRIKLGWNIKLPVNGSGIHHCMDHYEDRLDTDLRKTLDDDGQFRYCLCISDVKENILYSPYELRVTSVDETRKYPIYYTVSASYTTKVMYFFINFK